MNIAGYNLSHHAEKRLDSRREINIDGFVKSPNVVMPDPIRHPEPIEITGFRLAPE